MFESLSAALARAFEKFRTPRLTERNVEEGLRAVRTALLEADVHYRVVRDLIDRVKARALGEEVLRSVAPSQQIVKAFHEELVAVLGGTRASLPLASEPPTVVLLAGLQGCGKTTTCAKLGLALSKEGRRPLLVAADLKRPAAVEQLRTLGKTLGIPVHPEAGNPGKRASAVCLQGVDRARAEGRDLVLLDSAGRLHVDQDLMAELAEIRAKTRPRSTLLVLDATAGQDALSSAQAFEERLSLDGVVLTKLDGDARGGAALSVRAVLGKPILFVGVGERPEDLEPFHPERMASRILGMGDVVTLVEKAQESIREEETAEAYEALLEGSFTLEDLHQNLKRVRRLGPLKKVASMLPGGFGNLLGEVDEHSLGRFEAIFLSMTAEERRHPDLLDGSRRARIAKGSGNPASAVNDLLRAYRTMRDQMKGFRALLTGSGRKRLLRRWKGAGSPFDFPPNMG